MCLFIYFFFLRDLQLFFLVVFKKWVFYIDIQKFDILLCIGNKVDFFLSYFVYDEYRRCLQRIEDFFVSLEVNFFDYGIFEIEGSSLLGNDKLLCDVSRLCLEWCMEYNIEYVEVCVFNVDFDKCKLLV